MPPTTTILDYTTGQVDSLTQALKDANAALTDRQKVLTDKNKARDDAKAQLAAIAAEAANVRKQLADTATPDDAAAVQKQLQANMTKSRQATAALTAAENDAAGAKADVAAATAEVQRITTALGAANTMLRDATTQDARRTALKRQLAKGPLSTIVADAAAAAAGAAFKQADSRLAADLPAALRTQAEKRLATEVARSAAVVQNAQQAQSSLEEKQSSDGGIGGPVSKLQSEFQRADAAFSAYVTGAADRLKQANAILGKVGDAKSVSPLTPAQVTRIHDASLVKPAAAAAALEATLDDAMAKVAQKQAAYDQAVRQAKAADIDADWKSDAVVVAAKTALTTAEAALTTAKAAYTSAIEQQARDWEAAVPDSEWQLLADFARARDLLADLQTPGPTALSTAMDATENALVAAMLAADKSARTLAALQADADAKSADADYESTVSDARRFSAVRGDF